MTHDVGVAGTGDAALCAAPAARETGASVLVLEKAPDSQRGGNSFFTAGGFRFAHQGLEDLRRDVLPDISEEEARAIVVPPYTENQFYDDLMRVTEGRSDIDMAEFMVKRSRQTLVWMRGKGTRGISPPKSNWAQKLDTPPYVSFSVTCGITFTFGELRVDLRGQAQDIEDRPIRGLYASGELVGGLFYHNYAGGAGLMAGSVFGKAAGESAAADIGAKAK